MGSQLDGTWHTTGPAMENNQNQTVLSAHKKPPPAGGGLGIPLPGISCLDLLVVGVVATWGRLARGLYTRSHANGLRVRPPSGGFAASRGTPRGAGQVGGVTLGYLQ